jgi:hypothetical protein
MDVSDFVWTILDEMGALLSECMPWPLRFLFRLCFSAALLCFSLAVATAANEAAKAGSPAPTPAASVQPNPKQPPDRWYPLKRVGQFVDKVQENRQRRWR